MREEVIGGGRGPVAICFLRREGFDLKLKGWIWYG